MKHIDSITSPQPTRTSQYGFALMLLLVLIAMQSRGLALEPLASQLLSVNESISEQMLLPATNGDNDQPCLLVSTTNHTLRFNPPTEQQETPFHPSNPRWIAPSTRAPPVFS
ncbi:hypothetical protein [Amphritea sp.]|uniref:hypothetical protein n=1 Tax=Amphritea sp. TaxID=1872502 RepID=UPI003A8CE776